MWVVTRTIGISVIALLFLSGCVAAGITEPTATPVQVSAAPTPIRTDEAVATMMAIPEPVGTELALATEQALPTPTENLTPTEEPPTPMPTETPTTIPLVGRGFTVKWQKLNAGRPVAAGNGLVYVVTDSSLDA